MKSLACWNSNLFATQALAILLCCINQKVAGVRVDFSQTTYTVTEGTEMSVTVTIVRTGNMTDSASFTAFTVAVTAKEILDYTPVQQNITISPGQDMAEVHISIIDDLVLEENETFSVCLLSHDPDVDIDPSNGCAEVNIIDDGWVQIGFEETTYTAHEYDELVYVTAVIYEGLLSDAVEVDVYYQTFKSGTSSDIRQYRTTLIFRPLRTSRFVTIPIVDDTEYTQDVVVLVTLSLRTTGVDVLLNPDTTSIKILDDDGPLNFLSPTFTFSILTSDGAATTTTTADSAFPFGSSATARVYVTGKGYFLMGQDPPSTGIALPTIPGDINNIVAPYAADIDPSRGGSVKFTGFISTGNEINVINRLIQSQTHSSFSGRRMLIAEWRNVPKRGGNQSVTNSFQGIIITDNSATYAMFIYECGRMQWGGGVIGWQASSSEYIAHNLSGKSVSNDIGCLNFQTYSAVVYRISRLSCIADYVSSNDYLRCVRVDCNNIIDAEGNSDCTPDSGDDGGGASLSDDAIGGIIAGIIVFFTFVALPACVFAIAYLPKKCKSTKTVTFSTNNEASSEVVGEDVEETSFSSPSPSQRPTCTKMQPATEQAPPNYNPDYPVTNSVYPVTNSGYHATNSGYPPDYHVDNPPPLPRTAAVLKGYPNVMSSSQPQPSALPPSKINADETSFSMDPPPYSP